MKNTAPRLGGIALAMLALLSFSSAPPQAEQEPEAVFDPAADARALVATSTALAAKKNRRVLIVWGHDGADGDVDLHQALRRGKTDAWPYYYEYVITPVDRGARGDENGELAKTLGAPDRSAGAVLTILDASSKPLAHRTAAELRSDEGWDSALIGSFLTEHIAKAQDAEVVLKRALATAKAKNKRLFVHLGAPW